jgi:hypothetical protein
MNQSSKKVLKQTKNVSSNKNRSTAVPKQRNNQKRTSSPGNASSAFRPRKNLSSGPPLVAVAAAYAKGQRSSAPRIEATRDQVRIVHRELIGSITGSVVFTTSQTVALNPGLPASFPWLATQAQAWERYRFNRLRFCYYTRTGSNVPGSVMMIPDYDASDAAPFSEQIASTYEDVEEDAPWKDIECELRPASLHALGPSKFVRTNVLSANLDIKTYDAGNFFLATVDGTAVSWGKLWVEYDVTLMTPQLNPAGSGVIVSQHLSGSTPTTAALLGAAPVTASNSANLVGLVGEVLTFNQAGKFSVVYAVDATTSVTQTGVPTLSANASYSTLGSFGSTVFAGGSGTGGFAQYAIVNVVVGSTMTFNNTIVAGLLADLLITQLPAALG